MNTLQKLSKDFPRASQQQLEMMSKIDGDWTLEGSAATTYVVLERYANNVRKTYLMVGIRGYLNFCVDDFPQSQSWSQAIGHGRVDCDIDFEKLNRLLKQYFRLKNFK